MEVSGALGELKQHVLPNDYPDLDFKIMNLHLVDAGLPAVPAFFGVMAWFSTTAVVELEAQSAGEVRIRGVVPCGLWRPVTSMPTLRRR